MGGRVHHRPLPGPAAVDSLAIVEDLLRQGLPELGIPQDEALVTAFASYLRLLAQWNENINLTGIRELADMVPLHILDSLTARPFLKGERIVDVGCGAGLPGIPLALTEPTRHFTLRCPSPKSSPRCGARRSVSGASLSSMMVRRSPVGPVSAPRRLENGATRTVSLGLRKAVSRPAASFTNS